jgi:hypothetical protein
MALIKDQLNFTSQAPNNRVDPDLAKQLRDAVDAPKRVSVVEAPDLLESVEDVSRRIDAFQAEYTDVVKRLESNQAKQEKRSVRHDWLVAVFSTIAGAALALVVEHLEDLFQLFE